MVCEGILKMVSVVALMHFTVGQEAGVVSSCTNGLCGSGVAHSQSTDANGITTGECAYINARGQQVKIKYRQTPDGRIDAKASEPYVQDPRAELRACREAVKHVSHNVQQNIFKTQEQLQRQQEQLQKEIFRTQQAIFGQGGFAFPPLFAFPNRFPFHNIPRPQF